MSLSSIATTTVIRAVLFHGMVITIMDTWDSQWITIIGLPTVGILSRAVTLCITHDSTTKRNQWMYRYHCSVGFYIASDSVYK